MQRIKFEEVNAGGVTSIIHLYHSLFNLQQHVTKRVTVHIKFSFIVIVWGRREHHNVINLLNQF